MERKLATIQRVKSVDPIFHPSDGSLTSLTLIKFEDIAWQCVAKAGEFSPGDLAVYIEISSIVPEHPVFEFLRARHWKVKTVRLCGVLSQGLALPLNVLHDMWPELLEVPEEDFLASFLPGKDVTEFVGVTRYEPPVDVRINGSGRVSTFPTDVVPKTDEERIQSVPHILEHFKGMGVVATLKHDGTSATYFWDAEKNKLRVCSRNMEKMDPDDSVYWKIVEMYPDVVRMCEENPTLVFQGEITAPGIQKNPMGRTKPVFTVFNVYDREAGNYMPYFYAEWLVFTYNVPFVEVVHQWESFESTVPELLEIAKGNYESGKPREGIVLRPWMEERYVYVLGGRLSCKVINNDYLEKGGE